MSFTKRFLESIGFFDQEDPQQFWNEYLQYEEYLLTQKAEQSYPDSIEDQSL
jgi:hypothetical protein